MDSNCRPYDWEESARRIDGYLTAPRGNYEETRTLPDRDRLTFENGFYANCSAIFIDIRDSSSLPGLYDRPRLARLYRAYLSEMVAVLNSEPGTREVNIAGDAVWAVINTPSISDIDNVFRLAFTANTLIKVLNNRLAAAEYKTAIRAGIGAAYGRALMVKAGYRGSGINDVVYMGDVVNEAAHLAANAAQTASSPEVLVSDVFYTNLNDHNKSLLRRDALHRCYSGNVLHAAMDEWLEDL